MITDSQEARLAAAEAIQNGQDKQIPFLINRNDGWLMPNTRYLRTDPNYIPYRGKVHASLAERMAYLKSGGTHRQVILPADDDAGLPPFDIGKATKDELVTFAAQEYSVTLSTGTDIRTLRKQVATLAGGGSLSDSAAPTGAELT